VQPVGDGLLAAGALGRLDQVLALEKIGLILTIIEQKNYDRKILN
jgi:hypothetical protein